MYKPVIRQERQRELDESIHVSTWYDLKDFIVPESVPVVSIYVPIHRTQREGRRDEWDRIEFKDLAAEARRRLAESYEESQIAPLVERLDYLLAHEDLPLWIDASAGLAFLISRDDVYVLNLTFAPKPEVVAGDAYYLKPLIRNLAEVMDYKLLLLNADFFALLTGDYSGVSYVPLPKEVKEYFAETYPEFDGETTALDYYSLEDHESPYHGHKSRNDVKQEEAEKFFRYVNKAMNDILVRGDDAPVILVTAPEHDHMFREICTFSQLIPEGIMKDARTLSGTELRDGAVAIMEKRRAAEVQDLKERYGYQESKGTASDDPDKIGLMLVERMVDTLFLEEGKGIPGSFDDQTGAVAFDGSRNPVDADELDPASGDIADAFARAAIAQDSDIVVLAADAMPSDTGVAAIFRN